MALVICIINADLASTDEWKLEHILSGISRWKQADGKTAWLSSTNVGTRPGAHRRVETLSLIRLGEL